MQLQAGGSLVPGCHNFLCSEQALLGAGDKWQAGRDGSSALVPGLCRLPCMWVMQEPRVPLPRASGFPPKSLRKELGSRPLASVQVGGSWSWAGLLLHGGGPWVVQKSLSVWASCRGSSWPWPCPNPTPLTEGGTGGAAYGPCPGPWRCPCWCGRRVSPTRPSWGQTASLWCSQDWPGAGPGALPTVFGYVCPSHQEVSTEGVAGGVPAI